MNARMKEIIKSNKTMYKLALILYKLALTLYKLALTLEKPFRTYPRNWVLDGETKLNILKSFPMYRAGGEGRYPIVAKLTILSINQTMPALAKFSLSIEKNVAFGETFKRVLLDTDSENQSALKELFKKYGSDKSTKHNYYKIYAEIIQALNQPKKIFEIGLGTDNIDIVSTMGIGSKPGGSLRAFRDFQKNCEIYGADLDTRILFSEERIKTYFVDQTKPESFDDLSKNIGDNFDLMIDDGLHSPNANLHSLEFFLRHIKVGGFAVIEDINVPKKPIWDIVSHLIEPNFLSVFIRTKSAYMFIVKRER